MYSRHVLPTRHVLAMSLITLAAVLVAVSPAGARSRSAAPAEENHCVASVVEQTPEGELLIEEPECFETVAEAEDATAAKNAAATVSATSAGEDLASTDASAGTTAIKVSFVLGTHYDGNSGTGASISISGTSCSGGYWNATGTWKNRINSTKNGCYRLVHYDYQNKAGMTFTTYGVGQIDNLGWFANKTESVSYHR